jgi:hypothetical protein
LDTPEKPKRKGPAKKWDWSYIALIVAAGLLFAGTFFYQAVGSRKPLPETSIGEFSISYKETRHMLTAALAYGANSKGFPDTSRIIQLPALYMDGNDIVIVQTGSKVEKYVVKGEGQYLAFPDGNVDDVDWDGARLLYFRDGILVSGREYSPLRRLSAQIADLMESNVVTMSPAIFAEGILYSPGFCRAADLATCEMREISVPISELLGVEVKNPNHFLVVKPQSVNAQIQTGDLYIPVTNQEVQQLVLALSGCAPKECTNKMLCTSFADCQ